MAGSVVVPDLEIRLMEKRIMGEMLLCYRNHLEEEEKKAAKAAGKEGDNAKQEGELESLLREFLA